ncbi:MAG: META domain-containing protein [Burkholderiales bacterium]|nr:META domain-containing protein [Burkholderiales bacterium]
MTSPSRKSAGATAAAIAATLVAACATPADPSAPRTDTPAAAVGKVWEWRGTASRAGTLEPTVQRTYSLRLQDDGVAHILADCTFVRTRYEISAGRIRFEPVSVSRKGCMAPSLGDQFLADVTRATAFFAQGGQLYLDLPNNAGTMRFVPAPFWPPYQWTW